MLGLEDMTAWAAVGTSAFAALLVVLAIVLMVRFRRASERRLRTVQESTARTEELVSELRQSLGPAEDERNGVREQDERAERETQRLRVLSQLVSTLDLEAVTQRALEYAAEEIGADGAMAVLRQGDAEAFISSIGLSPAESERELVALPPDANEARAVTIRYRYSAEEAENDAFRLTCCLAVPLEPRGPRLGTLAVFWRRTEHEPGDAEAAQLGELAASLAGPLENARRFEEARRLADLDPLTGLQNERCFADRLEREVPRARRHERRLALLLFRFPVATSTPADPSLLGSVGRRVRSAVRSADIACHPGDGRFEVILPEVGFGEADHLNRRLQFTVGARLGATAERAELPAAAVELQAEDIADSLLHRADEALRTAWDETEGTAKPAETRL